VVVSRLPAVPLALVVVLAGCDAGTDDAPAQVRVATGSQDVAVRPTQYCLNGERQRYTVTPPILEVSPGAPIALTVPDAVAEHGWSVQVFDEKLDKELGEVPVPKGTAVYDKITSNDVVPPAFYLVVVENKGGDCGAFSGAWPIGFLRAGGDVGTPATGTPSPGSATPSK
jgi:hypothetical protein